MSGQVGLAGGSRFGVAARVPNDPDRGLDRPSGLRYYSYVDGEPG